MSPFSVDNFGNEGARNYLEVLAAKLLATINEIFIDDERLEIDEDGEVMFMPSVELLALMCERYNLSPPKPESIRQWQVRYLEIYDADAGTVYADEGFRQGRRKVIQQTFQWLLSLSESYWAS